MKKIIYSFVLISVLFSLQAYSTTGSASKPLVQFVNPFVGTDFHGHTFPGATAPFGMVQLSPDTRIDGWDGCSGYHYSDSVIFGFSHTHLSGTGVADYCDILLMPVSGYNQSNIDKEHYKSEFSHKNEKATPGYYEVFLDRWKVKVQLTAGKRVGMHKYTFKEGSSPQIIIDLSHRDEVLDSRIEVVNSNSIKGYRQSRSWAKNQIVYYYIEFSKPFQLAENITDNKDLKALLNFGKISKSGLTVKVGISSVSEENAKMNLLAEVKGWDFEQLKNQTEKAWNEYLNKIEIVTSSNENKKIFYTALYHTAISPNLYSDVNGEYRGMDRKIHKAVGYDQYTVFSLWDTYRALHPLFTIIEQRRTADFIKSFLAIYNQAGKLPIWELAGNETNCMIGYHSVSVIADAINKKIEGIDSNKALEAMVASSNRNEYGIDLFIKNGYVPAEGEHESVSKTLEYAYDDWCIAMVAKITGNKEVYEKYIRRAQYYKNVFDPTTVFMRPKINGSWLNPFVPTEVNVNFTEANSWQYSFYVPQDIETHIKLVGGDSSYTAMLDKFFSVSSQTTGNTQADITGMIGQYAHGNEPSHHACYLYVYAGQPWKTQELSRRIMRTLYSTAPDGLCGNDDCGQMSAWYVLSSMGFYPVTPGTDSYILGSPLFSQVTVNLKNGKKFTIKAPAANDQNMYIKSVSLNGNPYSKSYIRHSDIISGSTFNIEMCSSPDHTFAIDYPNRPHSKISESVILTNPWFEIPNNIFKDSVIVRIKSAGKYNHLLYRINNQTNEDYNEYLKPITIKSTSSISAYITDNSGEKSHIVTTTLNKIDSTLKIRILSHYNPLYNAGGDEGLVDGIRGKTNFRLGGWQGYQSTDFEAIVDLGKDKAISKIGAGFLQDAGSWIWMPQYAEFSVSSDGVNFTPIARVGHNVDPKDYNPKVCDLCKDGLNIKTRYIKVFAKNYGTIPQWHLGAGGEAFIFIDEIIVE